MADKAIGDLEAASKLYTADLIPIEQGGNAKRISGAILAEFARERGAQAAAGAEAYAEEAEKSAQRAEAWSAHPPYIGANGNWWIYDTALAKFVDSGIDASITIKIADITMLSEGAAPYVTNTGTNTDPVFHLYLPIGATGATGNGISSIRFNSDYTLTINYTNGTSYKTGSIRGATGNGIANVELNADYTLTITYTDGQKEATGSIRGERGATGNGIASIAKTATSNNIDTYTISFTDGNKTTFTVVNGLDGISPSVRINKQTTGHEVVITDKEHPTGQSFNVDNGVSPSVTVANIPGGHRITIVDEDHPTGQSFDVLDGAGAGDMTSTTYDPNGDVAAAGGIKAFVAANIPTGVEETKNRVTAIDNKSDDDHYPSAKAVYSLFNSIVNANSTSY